MHHYWKNARTLFAVAVFVGTIGSFLPSAHAIDPSWRLLTADYNGAKVRMFDLATGAPHNNLSTPPFVSGSTPTAWGIAVDSWKEKIYVSSDAADGKIYRLNLISGALDTTFNGTGSITLTNPSAATHPLGWNMTIGPDGNVYVAEQTTGLIWKINSSTAAATVFSTSPTHLVAPADLEFGSDGNLYVADYPAGYIRKYNGTTGAWMADVLPYDPVNHSTGLPGSTYDPLGLTFAPDGTVYITDKFVSQYRIRHYTSSFTWINDLTTGLWSAPYSSKFGPDGRLYTSDYAGQKIYVWDLNTSTASIWASSTGNIGYLAFAVPEPSTLALLAGGLFLVVRRFR